MGEKQREHAGAVALDQPFDHHGGDRLARDARMLMVRSGGQNNHAHGLNIIEHWWIEIPEPSGTVLVRKQHALPHQAQYGPFVLDHSIDQPNLIWPIGSVTNKLLHCFGDDDMIRQCDVAILKYENRHGSNGFPLCQLRELAIERRRKARNLSQAVPPCDNSDGRAVRFC